MKMADIDFGPEHFDTIQNVENFSLAGGSKDEQVHVVQNSFW